MIFIILLWLVSSWIKTVKSHLYFPQRELMFSELVHLFRAMLEHLMHRDSIFFIFCAFEYKYSNLFLITNSWFMKWLLCKNMSIWKSDKYWQTIFGALYIKKSIWMYLAEHLPNHIRIWLSRVMTPLYSAIGCYRGGWNDLADLRLINPLWRNSHISHRELQWPPRVLENLPRVTDPNSTELSTSFIKILRLFCYVRIICVVSCY